MTKSLFEILMIVALFIAFAIFFAVWFPFLILEKMATNKADVSMQMHKWFFDTAKRAGEVPLPPRR